MVAVLGPAAGVAAGAPCGRSTAAPRQLTLHQMRTSELCLINRVRAHYGLRRLVFNRSLRDAATGHSDSMVAHHYFGHEGPGGSMDSRISRTGYLHRARAFAVGENIGGGPGRRYGSPKAVFEEWMHSPPHRANILDPSYRDVGVGVARGYPTGAGAGSATYTVDFGARQG
ncbi:MAG TPA: CAP domain-containing protein [Solirubrobacterales bacterium]|nr:CAP domain-containing protein [Solirubrobacterales bacterium]